MTIIIDLTQKISADMPVYPGTEPPKFVCGCSLEKDGFKELEMTLFTHTGTHIDSPAHLYHHGATLDQLPIEHFVGSGIVIDCSHLTSGQQISLELLTANKEKLAQVDFVLFNTGWGKKWGHNDYFDNFPVLTEEAAQLLAELKLKGVGIDAISVEPISAKGLNIHKLLLKQNIIIIENLTNLEQLVNCSFSFSCLPLKIEAADGSPVRAVALR